MKPDTKKALMGTLHTFLATFFSVLALQFGSGNEIVWDASFIFSVLVVAARTAVKPAMEFLFKQF